MITTDMVSQGYIVLVPFSLVREEEVVLYKYLRVIPVASDYNYYPEWQDTLVRDHFTSQ